MFLLLNYLLLLPPLYFFFSISFSCWYIQNCFSSLKQQPRLMSALPQAMSFTYMRPLDWVRFHLLCNTCHSSVNLSNFTVCKCSCLQRWGCWKDEWKESVVCPKPGVGYSARESLMAAAAIILWP